MISHFVIYCGGGIQNWPGHSIKPEAISEKQNIEYTFFPNPGT